MTMAEQGNAPVPSPARSQERTIRGLLPIYYPTGAGTATMARETPAAAPSRFGVLEEALSSERLTSYVHSDDATLDSAIARYLWNTALCEALYPVLHLVEVSLRNRVDSVLRASLGEFWMLDAALLAPRELRKATEARRYLASRGTQPSHSDLVAELGFGFWVALFNRNHEQQGRLWPRFSSEVLRGAPRKARTRREFHRRLDDIRRLRNRAFHYEPLWHWADLDGQYERACEMLGWLSPEVAELAAQLDRFREVRERGFDAYECVLGGGFICPIHNRGCRHVAGQYCESAMTAGGRA